MWTRILALTRASLAGEWLGDSGQRIPVAPVLLQLSIASALCLLARGELTGFAYSVFALSIPLALTALPLLGELGPLLLEDPAAEWIGAQPVRPVELRVSRVLVLALLVGSLALGALLPAALLAPAELGILQRGILVLAGLGQTACVAAALLWLQALLGRRAEALLVGLQTALLAFVLVGFVASVRFFPLLAELGGPTAGMLAYPPAWFASLVTGGVNSGTFQLVALASTALALLTFAVAPFPPRATARRTNSALGLLLYPVRVLATRLWVRPGERGIFDLVYEALPAERDFVIRAYPLVGAPLALLFLGAEPGDPKGEGLFALLLFSPAIYLPVMLLYVPATATPAARWLVDTSPLHPADEASGAQKAIFVRFLLPLYVALFTIASLRVGLDLSLRVAPIAVISGLVVLRAVWPRCVQTPPLSTSPGELGSAWENEFSGLLFGVGLGMVFVSIAAWRQVPSPAVGVGIGVLALVVELQRARTGHARGALGRGPAAKPGKLT